MTDEKIISLFFSRDEAALEHVEKKYGSYCFTIANNILGNSQDSEECVNDTYLAAWRSIPPEKPKQLSSYLGKIVRNFALMRQRKDKACKRGGALEEISLELLTLIPDSYTDTVLPLALPDGWTEAHEAIGGGIYEVLVDGVKYELISRMIRVEKGSESALYLDLVDISNRKVLTSTLIEGYFRLYENNVGQNEACSFILERFVKNADGTVDVSTAGYAFTDLVTDASGSTKADFAFREVYNENNYSATVTLDPADTASAQKLEKLGKCTYGLAEFYYGSTSYGLQAYSNAAKTYASPISIADDWYTYSESFYTAQGLKDNIFEVKQ